MNKIIIIFIIPLFVLIALLFVSGCSNRLARTNPGTGEAGDNTLDIKGSDTLLQLVASMAEAYSSKNSEADITVTGGGSGTGIASILNGETDIANSSRDIKDKENAGAREQGKTLNKFIVARDGLSIIINKKNKISRLTLGQVAKIFKGEINNWAALGGEDKKINLYGRQSTSGTYEFMQKEVIKDDYKATMRNMEGNQSIIDAVISDTNSIGYVGAGYAISAKEKIKILDIAINESNKYYSPLEPKNITSGDYPITRPLYQVITKIPAKEDLMHNFFLFEISAEGNKIIEESGYFSPNAKDKEANKKLLR